MDDPVNVGKVKASASHVCAEEDSGRTLRELLVDRGSVLEPGQDRHKHHTDRVREGDGEKGGREGEGGGNRT